MIELLVMTNRQLFFCIEQPAQSWAFKCRWMLSAAAVASLSPGSTVELLAFTLSKKISKYSIYFHIFPLFSYIFIFFPSYFVGILLMNSRSFSLYPVLSSPPVMRSVVSTWQAFWGHDLPKPTHLLTNISHLGRSAGNWFRLGVVRCKS